MSHRRAAIVSLGCSRNDVDSEELAGRLDEAGWQVGTDVAAADVVLVNTCGFIEQAKADSINTLLDLAQTTKVVAVGCLAQRYGRDLAAELPSDISVLGFDRYPSIAEDLATVLAGGKIEVHAPQDRRLLLPITPIERNVQTVSVPGRSGIRARLDSAPWAPLKIASGCDRRCAFCAIPMFRGSYVSRPPQDVLAEANWLAERGVREVLLVSENSTSYGKDLGDLAALEKLLPHLAQIFPWVRVSYLQPAEIRPGLLEAISQFCVPYFDLSFQHASPQVLRRMRRFGGAAEYLRLIEQIRQLAPEAAIRSNVIVGFPGETEEDIAVLIEFLNSALLDATGVFGYSAEDGTEAATLSGHLDEDEIRNRVNAVAQVADLIAEEVAASRIGSTVDVLVESADGVGRTAEQGPEVDGSTQLTGRDSWHIGAIVTGEVTANVGADLVVRI